MSPGGTQGKMRRSRPDDEPSSAVPTTATGYTGRSHNAVRVADRPCPPPMAATTARSPTTSGVIRLDTLVALDVSMNDAGFDTGLHKSGSQVLSHGHTAVVTAGAADSDGDVRLAFVEEAVGRDVNKRSGAV